jgi:hypothetical protein
MAKTSVRNTTTAVLIAVVVGALAIAFLRPTSEIVFHETPDLDIESATVDAALVISRRQEGGFKAFGIRFSAPTYRVAVSFTAPPDCFEVISRATTWPTGDAACGPTGGIAGELSGLGTTALRDTIVAVTFEVTQDCFDATTVGDRWPIPACR